MRTWFTGGNVRVAINEQKLDTYSSNHCDESEMCILAFAKRTDACVQFVWK